MRLGVEVVVKLKQTVAEGRGLSREEAQDLATELNVESSRPFSQAFRVIASKANDLHARRKEKIVESLKGHDYILANTVKQAPLGHASLLKVDISDHIKESTNRASWMAMLKATQPRHQKFPRLHPYMRPEESRRHH